MGEEISLAFFRLFKSLLLGALKIPNNFVNGLLFLTEFLPLILIKYQILKLFYSELRDITSQQNILNQSRKSSICFLM